MSCSAGPQTARADKSSGARKKLNMNAGETVGELTNETGSEVTVYKQAVVIDDAEANNGSQAVSELRVDQQIMGSSDEFNNTSEESGNTDTLIKQMNDFDVAGTETSQPTAHCSYQSEPRAREMGNTLKRHIPTPKERAEQLIKEAKLAKEKLARIPGKGVVEDNTGKISWCS